MMLCRAGGLRTVGYMDIYLFCIVQKEFIFNKIAEGIVVDMGVYGVLSVCAT